MAVKPITQNEEYAERGPEHEILVRKREETLTPRKRVQMVDSDDSSSLQPSKDDFRRFWYDSELFLGFWYDSELLLLPLTFGATGIRRLTRRNLL
jgi:hypothetical protein